MADIALWNKVNAAHERLNAIEAGRIEAESTLLEELVARIGKLENELRAMKARMGKNKNNAPATQ